MCIRPFADSPQKDRAPSAALPDNSQTCQPWYDAPLVPKERRQALPKPAQPAVPTSVFHLVKHLIGKRGLTFGVALPVFVNEPVTDCSIRGEIFQHSYLLDKAATESRGSLDRLLLVQAFAVSIISVVRRANKHFTDMDQGTFDWVDPSRGLRVLCKKVERSPPRIACRAEGRRWRVDCDDVELPALSLHGLQIDRDGTLEIIFEDDDTYRGTVPSMFASGLFIGPRVLTHRGLFLMRCLTTGNVAHCRAHDGGLFKHLHKVEGTLLLAGDKPSGISISGHWDGALHALHADGSQALLFDGEPPQVHPNRWNFNPFACQMNELTPELAALLPATDARFRRDMRLFEQGFSHAAQVEKMRLEARQRKQRKEAIKVGSPWQPRWFKRVPSLDHEDKPTTRYMYQGGYWEARASGQWPADMRDPYGLD